jgi:hypothetical protein
MTDMRDRKSKRNDPDDNTYVELRANPAQVTSIVMGVEITERFRLRFPMRVGDRIESKHGCRITKKSLTKYHLTSLDGEGADIQATLDYIADHGLFHSLRLKEYT